jgi:hypothetical protein
MQDGDELQAYAEEGNAAGDLATGQVNAKPAWYLRHRQGTACISMRILRAKERMSFGPKQRSGINAGP